MSILQTSLDKFQFDMLREKQPIVIHDRLPSMNTIQELWFRWNIVKTFTYNHTESLWNKNRYKYLILHPMQECEIYVVLGNTEMLEDGFPNPETSTPVVLKMQPNQIIILPYRSYWMTPASDTNQIHCMGIHDIVSFFLP